MNINKIVEKCIYSSDLDDMKKFYVDILGLPSTRRKKWEARFLACRQEHALDIHLARPTPITTCCPRMVTRRMWLVES